MLPLKLSVPSHVYGGSRSASSHAHGGSGSASSQGINGAMVGRAIAAVGGATGAVGGATGAVGRATVGGMIGVVDSGGQWWAVRSEP